MWQIISLIGSLITGIGLGSIICTWLGQSWERKKMIYQTKLDLYSKFIESYQESAAKPKDELLRQLCVANQKKLELIASKKIIELSKNFYTATSEKTSIDIRDKLVEYMREDLGIL